MGSWLIEHNVNNRKIWVSSKWWFSTNFGNFRGHIV